MKTLSSPPAAVPAGLVLAILLHTAPAAAGDGVVGTATLELESGANGRKVTTELWFKTAPNAKAEWFSPRPPLRPILIARNAVPQPSLRKHPLIVFSHGNWGSRFSQGWLALELVKAGYVVLSTSHPGTEGDDQTVAGRYRLWDRSRDVSLALDEVLEKPQVGRAHRREPHRLRRSLLWRLDRRQPGWRQVRSRSTESLLPECREEGLLLRGYAEGRCRGGAGAGRRRVVQRRADQSLLHHGLGTR
jgi:hypothetical protein